MATKSNSPKRRKTAVADQQPLGFDEVTAAADEVQVDGGGKGEEGGAAGDLIRVVDSFIDDMGPDNGYTKKPVEAITIQPTEGKLTLQARRWYNVLLRHAQVNEPQAGQRIRMPLRRFLRDARQEKVNNEYMSEVLKILVSTPIEWGDSAKNLQGASYQWSVSTLLSYASITKKSGTTELIYDFDPAVKAKMLEPEVYAKISLDVQAKMSTYAALYLYELGTRYYKPRDQLSSKERPWKEWVVAMLGNRKVSIDKLLFKTFARDTLKPALQEVNDPRLGLPWEIRAETRKVARRVEALRFTVTARQPRDKDQELGTAEGLQIEVDHLTLIGRLINLGVTQASAVKLYNEYGHETLRQGVDNFERHIERRPADSPPIENIVSYLHKVLKTVKVGSDVVDVESKVVSVGVSRASSPPGGTINAVLAKKYQEVHRKDSIALFEESTDAMKQEEYDRFESEGLAAAGNAVQREWAAFRKKGNGAKLSPLLRTPFFKWLVRDAELPNPDELEAWGRRNGFVTVNIG